MSCDNKKKDYAPIQKTIDQYEVTIKEVLQTGTYTYLLVQETQEEYWMAVQKFNAEVGEKIYFIGAMEMNNFESKELNRVFDKIFFVDQISKTPINTSSRKAEVIEKRQKEMEHLLDSIKITPAEGGQSIGELYSNADKFKQKTVFVRGQVVKVNMDIMDRNWVHLVDGTKGSDKSDLTFTTQELVKVGDTVVFKGVLAIDREFGAGYVYPLIVEEAVLIQ
jgi:hypothetical protein